ncbi:unnamed protein product [Spirodela intermedia]|uniref:Uncharacterized protein n=1 Tax=Spirodela intermedia TaxID=51605 RepID=A0A7I8K6H0_SPIIN|nr:unnamed protein product [Spirodela intermedia]
MGDSKGHISGGGDRR